MRADIDALVAVLEEAHPVLHYHNPREAWLRRIAQTRQALTDSLSPFAFYRRVAPLVAGVHEEHTYVAPTPALEKAHQQQRRVLPFEVFVIENRAYIDSSHVREAVLPRGTELLSVNGAGVGAIITDIREKANFATGTETGFVPSILNGGFNFAMGYSYFIDDSTHFRITYRVPGSGDTAIARVAGMLNPYPKKTFPDWAAPEAPFLLRHFPGRTAYLKVSRFGGYPSRGIRERHVFRFFRKSFAEIHEKGAGHLVVDLRDNGGGNPRMASEFLRYLVPTPFVPIAYTQLKTQQISSVHKVRNPQDFRIAKSLLKCDQGRLVVRHLGVYKKHTPRKRSFRGKVYFLMNAKCASATSILLVLADYYRLGTFIGENPSGNGKYVCGHQLARFSLPHAELWVQVPVWQSHINTPGQSMRGVRPDHYVPDNWQDVINRQDTQLNFVLDLIRNGK